VKSYLTEALEIVKAQASVRMMTEEEIISMVKKLVEKLYTIGDDCKTASIEEETYSINPQKAIKEKSITCVVCGKTFKLITKKHLASHGLTVEEYREHCGYKKGTPLVCKFLQRERRKKMQGMRLWERRKPQGE